MNRVVKSADARTRLCPDSYHWRTAISTLPAVPIPADNLQTETKINLGDRLFQEQRFSPTGEVACATCHATETAMTDSPLTTSEGIKKLTGTRNAPTVLNAAFNQSQFWDGRSPSLEDQALHPFLNPIEMVKARYPVSSVFPGYFFTNRMR
ncbi:MAG: cytochrome-c peroxidase [Proteobacteria bacterium]|nr:cytochrome-c peroxidase [Pseudomonadota bacterium]